MQEHSSASALASLLAKDQLVDMDHFRKICNLREEETPGLLAPESRLFASGGSNWAVSTQRWSQADQLLMEHIDQWHQEKPRSPGIKMTELKPAMAENCESPLAMAVLVSRLEAGDLVLHEGRIRRANFQAAVSAQAIAHWQQMRQCLADRGHQIPLLSELSEQTGIAVEDLNKVAKDAEKTGELCRITDTRYALPEQLMRFAREVLSCDSNGEPVTVIGLKSRFGSGRRLTIEILEYFDRVHFTRRQGDARVILNTELPLKLFKG
jgi:selenocysteine-specific elongation factor